MKLLEDTIRVNFHNLEFGNGIFAMTAKTQATKENR